MQQFHLQKWTKRNMMAMAIFAITAVAIYNWFIMPHTRYLSAAQQYEDTINSIERKSKVLNANIQMRRKTLEELSRKYESRKQAFFDIEEAKAFLSNLQSTAEKNGCMVVNLKFSPAKQVIVNNTGTIDIRQYQADLNLQGGYGNIVKFLNTVQKRTAKVWVDSINFGMKASENNYLNCNVILSIYTLKVKENTNNVNNIQK